MKIKKYMILVSAVALVTVSCTKKGNDDPMLSLISRDARLLNQWKLTGVEQQATYTESSFEQIFDNASQSTITKEVKNVLMISKFGDENETRTTVKFINQIGADTYTESTLIKENFKFQLHIQSNGLADITMVQKYNSVKSQYVPTKPLPPFISSSTVATNSIGNYSWYNNLYDREEPITEPERSFSISCRWNWVDTEKNKSLLSIEALGLFSITELRNNKLVLEQMIGAGQKGSTNIGPFSSNDNDKTRLVFTAE